MKTSTTVLALDEHGNELARLGVKEHYGLFLLPTANTLESYNGSVPDKVIEHKVIHLKIYKLRSLRIIEVPNEYIELFKEYISDMTQVSTEGEMVACPSCTLEFPLRAGRRVYHNIKERENVRSS